MSKNGSLIVFISLYSGVTKARWLPQLKWNTRPDLMFVYYDQAYYLLDSLQQENIDRNHFDAPESIGDDAKDIFEYTNVL